MQLMIAIPFLHLFLSVPSMTDLALILTVTLILLLLGQSHLHETLQCHSSYYESVDIQCHIKHIIVAIKTSPQHSTAKHSTAVEEETIIGD